MNINGLPTNVRRELTTRLSDALFKAAYGNEELEGINVNALAWELLQKNGKVLTLMLNGYLQELDDRLKEADEEPA